MDKAFTILMTIALMAHTSALTQAIIGNDMLIAIVCTVCICAFAALFVYNLYKPTTPHPITNLIKWINHLRRYRGQRKDLEDA